MHTHTAINETTYIHSVSDACMLLLNSMKFYCKYKHNEVSGYFVSFNLQTHGSSHDYNTHQTEDIGTNRAHVNLTEKCLRNHLPKTTNYIPNQILIRIDTHRTDWFVSAVKLHLVSKYGMECQDENRPVSQIRAPSGGLSRTSGKLWQDYSNCYMFWT